MSNVRLYRDNQSNLLNISQLAEFDTSIAHLTQSQQRRRRLDYLTHEADKIKEGKSLLKGFGWFMIPLALIPIFWPFFAVVWYLRKKRTSIMEAQFEKALDYWGIHQSLIDDYLDDDTFD